MTAARTAAAVDRRHRLSALGYAEHKRDLTARRRLEAFGTVAYGSARRAAAVAQREWIAAYNAANQS